MILAEVPWEMLTAVGAAVVIVSGIWAGVLKAALGRNSRGNRNNQRDGNPGHEDRKQLPECADAIARHSEKIQVLEKAVDQLVPRVGEIARQVTEIHGVVLRSGGSWRPPGGGKA